MSVWVKEKTWPTCSDPLTVGGGVSIEKTASRLARRVEPVGALLFPAGVPFGFEAFERRLFWETDGMRGCGHSHSL